MYIHRGLDLICCCCPVLHIQSTVQNKTNALPVVGMGPSWLSIEHGHSGITAHLEIATFNVCETLNLVKVRLKKFKIAARSPEPLLSY